MKKAAILFIFFILPITFLYPEVIRFKDGRVIQEKIVFRDNDKIRVNLNGTLITYYLDDIQSIDPEKQNQSQSSYQQSTNGSSLKEAEQIFNEVADSIVVINVQTALGGALGSGFVVDSNGIIVTNFHVISEAENATVKFKNGSSYPITEVIDYDPVRDFFVFKINASGLPVTPLGNSDNLTPGQKVLVIGAPLGLDYTISNGLFSGIRDDVSGQKIIQFTAPISPGNSGGPLLNMQGQAIGMATFTNMGGQNLNFAISINEIKEHLRDLRPKTSFKDFVFSMSDKDTLYELGENLFDAGILDQALNYFLRVIELDPNYIKAYEKLAPIYYFYGQPELEKQAYDTILAIDPRNVNAHIQLGTLYFENFMYPEAAHEFETVVSIDPKNSVAHHSLCAVYSEQDFIDDALAECKEAVSLDPNSCLAHMNLGWVYYKKNLLNQALDETKKSLEIDPNYPTAHYNLSYIYYDLGDYNLAIEHCDKAMQLGRMVEPAYLEKLRMHRR